MEIVPKFMGDEGRSMKMGTTVLVAGSPQECGVWVSLDANTGAPSPGKYYCAQKEVTGYFPGTTWAWVMYISSGRPKPGEVSPFILLFIRPIGPLCNSIRWECVFVYIPLKSQLETKASV